MNDVRTLYTWPWHNVPLAWLTEEEAADRIHEIKTKKSPLEVPIRLRCFQPVPVELTATIPTEFAHLHIASERLRAEARRLSAESRPFDPWSLLLWTESNRLRDEGDRLWDRDSQVALALQVIPDAPWNGYGLVLWWGLNEFLQRLMIDD